MAENFEYLEATTGSELWKQLLDYFKGYDQPLIVFCEDMTDDFFKAVHFAADRTHGKPIVVEEANYDVSL